MALLYRGLKSWLIVALCVYGSLSFADTPLPAIDRLKSCDPGMALGAAKEILAAPHTRQEPLEMFPAVLTLYELGDKDDAVFWFYAAQLRMYRQLVFEAGHSRVQLLQVMQMTLAPLINGYAFQDISKLDRLMDRVLEWDRTTPYPREALPRSKDIDSQIEKIYSNFDDIRTRLLADKEKLERQAKEQAQASDEMAAQMRRPPCQPGQSDPAYANRIIAAEETSVKQFVTHHRDIVRAVGAVHEALIDSYMPVPPSELPRRYTVSVAGQRKTLFAEIDVLRSAGKVQFVLACLSSLSRGQRDAFKDVCAP